MLAGAGNIVSVVAHMSTQPPLSRGSLCAGVGDHVPRLACSLSFVKMLFHFVLLCLTLSFSRSPPSPRWSFRRMFQACGNIVSPALLLVLLRFRLF